MKKIIALMFLLPMIFIVAYATDLNELADNMPQSVTDITESATGGGNIISNAASALFSKASESFGGYLRSATKASFIILAICALAGMAQSFVDSSQLKLPPTVLQMCAVTAIAVVATSGAGSVISEIGQSLSELKVMLGSLMPAFTAATATAGNPVSAVMTSAVTMVFANGLISLGEKIVFPAAYLFILIFAAAQISGNPLILKTAKLIKWGVMACYKVALTLFTLYITMAGVLSGGADAVAAKAARVTISGVVPVLGGILADASDTLLAGATVLKNSIGIFGMAATVAVCLLPFLQALCLMLAYKITAAVGASLAGTNISQMLDGVADAYSILLGLMASCCAAVFIVMIVCTTVVNAL